MPHNHSGEFLKPQPKARRAALTALILFAGLLAACSGGAANKSWAGLAVKDDMVFLAHNAFISAVHLDTGQKAWQYPPEKGDLTVLFYSDPLIDSSGDLVAGAYNGSVVKLNAANGAVIWTLEGDGKAIIAPIAEGPDGAYYASSEGGDLLVIDPAAGTIRNRIALGKASSWGTMAVNGDRLYIATIEHQVLAVDFESETIAWSVDLGASIAGGVNLVDGKLVVGTFADRVIALDPQTGDMLWEAETDGWVWQAPVAADGALYAADLGGVLRSLSLADGAPIWNAQLTAAIQAGPAVEGETVFAGESKGMVRAYRTDAGTQKWEQKLEGGVFGKLQLAGGKLLVVVNSGPYQLAALHPESGAVIWTYTEPS
jgi:outer membrane protein assembly factor BamB